MTGKLNADLAIAQQAWNDTVALPNTVARNVVLADHRNEINRIQKLILIRDAPAKLPVSKRGAKVM